MKTLDQVEARTPIPGGTYTSSYQITAPGSYYLTGNVSVASALSPLVVAADQVTLDLNGFTVASTYTAGSGGAAVSVSGARTNVTIRGGHIQSPSTLSGTTFTRAGFFYGIYAPGTTRSVRVENVSVSGTGYGIVLNLSDSSGSAVGCRVNVNPYDGINAALVRDCVAVGCGTSGITGKTVSGCYADTLNGVAISGDNVADSEGNSHGSNEGLHATTANNCTGTNDNDTARGGGIVATTANNCYGSSTANTGLNATNANNCQAYCGGSGATALNATVANNCVANNNGSGKGISASIAVGCQGYCYSGTGLSATLANGCLGFTSTGTTVSASYKYNMP